MSGRGKARQAPSFRRFELGSKYFYLGQRFLARWGIWLLIVAFGFAYATVALLRHHHFESLYDLAIYDQEIWLLSRGLPPLVTIKQPAIIIWGDHYTPGLLLLAPLYLLVDNVRALLVAQVVIVVSGAWPICQLAKKIVGSTFFALATAFAFLAFVGVQQATLFDFHAITLVAAGLAWLFWLLERRNYFLSLVLIVVLLHLKEDVSLIIFSLAGYLLWRYRAVRLSLGLAVISLIWFFLVTRFYIPSYGGAFVHQSHLPKTLSGWWWVVFQPAEKLRTIFFSFLPFAFLPILAPGALLMALFHFLVHFIDPRYAGRWGLALHYRAPLAPILAVGAIWGARFLNQRLNRPGSSALPIALGFLIISGTVVNQIGLRLPLNGLLKPGLYREPGWAAATRFVLTRVPDQAGVVTQTNLLPQLTHRRDIRLLGVGKKRFALTDAKARLDRSSPCGLAECDWFETQDRRWLVIDLHPGQPLVNFWSVEVDRAQQALASLLWQDDDWWLVAQRGDAYLLRYQGGS